jgi:autotransporter-associated beta strand protein
VTPDAISVAVGTKTLTIDSAAVTPKTYTGTAGAVITGTLNGVVAGDTGTQISLVGTGTFDSSGVANGIGVTSTSTLTGTKASSYTLTQPTGLSGNITKATLTVRADNKNRLPGTANPSLTYTVSGYQNGEDAAVVGLTGAPVLSTDAVLGSPEGTYAITILQNTLVITSGNYTLDFVNGTLKVIGAITWAKGSGAWDIETSVNWTNAVFGAVTYVDGGEVLFNDLPAGFGPFTVTLNTTVHPSSVSFNNAAKEYVISGSGSISGTAALTKAGAGTLTLGMVNPYSGGTTVSGGKLAINHQYAMGSGPVTLAGGTILVPAFEVNAGASAITNAIILSGGFVTVVQNIDNAKDSKFTGPISGPGGLQFMCDPANSRSTHLAGAKTFSGGVTFKSGFAIVDIDNMNSLGSGPVRSEITSSTANGNILRAQQGVDLSTGLGVTNTIDIAPGAYFQVNTANTGDKLLFSGSITNSGSLVKRGAGTLTLSGVNTYTGTTTVVSGELTLANKYALGQTALIVEANTKVNLNYSGMMYIRALTINGAVQPIGIYDALSNPEYLTGSGRLNTGKPIIGTMIIFR